MPGLNHGLQRGFGMVVEAVIVAILLGELVPSLVKEGVLPPGLFWWVIPTSIVSAVMVVDNSRYWAYAYLAGVCIGIFFAVPIFLDAGLLSLFDLLIYGVIAIGAIALRVKIHSSSF